MTKNKKISSRRYKYRKMYTESMMDLENKLFSLLDQMRTSEMKSANEEGRKYLIHGLCAVLGYDPKQHDSYFQMQVGKDIFAKKDIYLHDPEALSALQEAMEIDGAILIDKNGKLMHSGRYMQADFGIYEKHEEAAATYQTLREAADAGTRHVAAVALSAQLPELLFYTLKSDHPQLRAFKGGTIYRSTIPGEARYNAPTAHQELETVY